MTDRIDFGGRPWAAIPREVLRDKALSARAKGGLVTLLSHDEGWVRSAIATLMNENSIGRDQAQSIMKELRTNGYAELVTERDLHGQVRRHYVVFAEPRRSEPSTSRSPVDGKPTRRESQPTGTPAVVVEPLPEEPLDEEPKTLVLPSKAVLAAEFRTWYDTYPRHEKPGAAERAYTKARRKVTAQVLMAGAIRYADDPNREPSFTMHPASWLNGECWADDPLPRRNGKLDKASLIYSRNHPEGVSRGSDTSRGPGRLAAGSVSGG